MRFLSPSVSGSRFRKDCGTALVITLAIIVILTVVIVAFFSQATSTGKIENSRLKHTEAKILATTGADYVVGKFLQEIRDGSDKTIIGTQSIFTPRASTNSVPARTLNSSIAPENKDFLSLLRQSTTGANGDASSHSTATASANGRFIGIGRWNKPTLLAGNGFQAVGQLPNWLYVNTDGGITNTPSAQTIGRFAYNVYRIGDLLDANIAGYPSGLSPTAQQKLQGTQAGADLTKIPTVPQTAVDALVAFRNPMGTGELYPQNVIAFQAKGFLSSTASPAFSNTKFKNRYFTSRQDLLRYIYTQNPDLAPALPYLTTFSRTLNSPTWRPSIDAGTYRYKTDAQDPASWNRDLLNVRFAAATTVEHYNDSGVRADFSVEAGEPLIQRRFSLAKLAWLTPTGPLAAVSNSAIQHDFGLSWDASDARWRYVAGKSTGEIKTLAEIAAENREPNFFELLKAGILKGSLGKLRPNQTLAMQDQRQREQNEDLQILRIGANMIDSADADNFPTTVSMSFGGTLVPVYGVEDLPYLQGLMATSIYKLFKVSSGLPVAPLPTTYRFDWCNLIAAPVLFNPHRASGASGSLTPERIRVRLVGGSGRVEDKLNPSGPLTQTCNFAGRPTIEIPLRSQTDVFRERPKVVRASEADSTTTLSSILTNSAAANPADTSIHAFLLHAYPSSTTFSHAGSNSTALSMIVSGVFVVLEFRDASGNWRIYDTLAGNEAFLGSGTGIDVGSSDRIDILPKSARTSHIRGAGGNPLNAADSTFLGKIDPRTTRYGVARSVAFNPDSTALMKAGSDTGGHKYQLPFAGGTDGGLSSGPADTHAGLWAQGDKSRGWDDSPTNPHNNVAGNDTILRPADGGLVSSDAANLFYHPTTANIRPSILQHPFRSAAELGYVFSDNPWKTLSFFDATSPDSSLLDFFTETDAPRIIAGRVNLNTQQLPVYEAILGGIGGTFDPAEVATALHNYGFSTGVPKTTLPLNLNEVANFMSSPELETVFPASAHPAKANREAIARALAGTSQTRTWNIFIDVIAQTGRFAAKSEARGAENFIVNGEERLWVSTAIDRYTGKVIDREVEYVDE